jgi:hypothetical protein
MGSDIGHAPPEYFMCIRERGKWQRLHKTECDQVQPQRDRASGND